MDEDEETPAKQEELSEKDVPSNPEKDAAEEEETIVERLRRAYKSEQK